ncbi:hypothetical protein B0A52_04107 [Exophiala mesophila]|uniref:DUF1740-domain-containing protein n=1 Tax=Exophiala mesophila TaxID=212818 RepID=A0A438NAC6_EXOME|nr:hypothetical protein B0A52_04107 [Exophiala mesophila]
MPSIISDSSRSRKDSHTRPHVSLSQPKTTNTSFPDSRKHSSESSTVSQNSLFVVDLSGDRRNLQYGEPDRYATPRYRLAGRGASIGLDHSYRTVGSTDARIRKIQNVELDLGQRSSKHSLLSTLPSEPPYQIKNQSTPADDLNRDFIALQHLPPTKKRRLVLGRLDDPHSTDDESDESETIEPVDSASNFETFKNDPVHQEHMRLSQATKDHPYDAEAWLKLIEYQDLAYDATNGPQESLALSINGLIDLKISLYEQALARVKDRKSREILITGLMQQGSRIWDSQKQRSQWQAYLNQDSSFDLWVMYLNFVQTISVGYSTQECLKVYRRCSSLFTLHPAGADRDNQLIYLVLRTSLLLWDTDHTELSIGLWQALLEFTFFRPPNLTSDQLMASFEEFWHRETPRIGEEGAMGWSSDSRVQVNARSDLKPGIMTSPPLQSWASIETALSQNAGLPARSLDEVDEADPYRVVLFSDISPHLFCPTTDEGLSLLLDAFLLFAGLDPVASLLKSQGWQRDPFLSTRSAHSQQLVSPSDMPLRQHWANRLSMSQRPADMYSAMVCRALSQLALSKPSALNTKSLMRYIIQLESRQDLGASRKMAKTFLKHSSSSLTLYNSFAVLESRLGNFEAAEKVWSTVFSMRNSLEEEDTCSIFHVWRDWIWSCMIQKLFQRANKLLSMIPDQHFNFSELDQSRLSPTAAAQIKSDRYLQAEIDSQIHQDRPMKLEPLIDLAVFSQYLSAGMDLSVAIRSYQDSLEKMSQATPRQPLSAFEAIHLRRAQFLHAHAKTFGLAYKPREMVKVLTESVDQFPENLDLVQFQHIYCQQAGIVDRLREVGSMAQARTTPRNVAISLFKATIELGRPAYSGSTDHSIRATFRRLIAPGESGAHFVNIWRTFVLWEASVARSFIQNSARGKEGDPGVQDRLKRVKDTFYMSLGACPWSKELYMLAFTDDIVRRALGEKALKEVYLSMSERGLRLRMDISEDLI